jgi:predicted dehydrogenase
MMVNRPLGAVVVGTNYGVLTHVRALREAGFVVVALVGRDGEKAKLRAEKLGVPHGLGDVGEALRLEGVDVVSVTTPPHTHAEITLAAIAAGKNVMCEKPFALDLVQARQVLAAARAAGVVHLMGFENRFGTTQESVRRVLISGRIGEPRSALLIRHLPSLVNPAIELPDWWESAAQGGGWLGALGSHLIDELRTMVGEFEGVSASLQTLAPRPAMTADDTYTIHFRSVGGCTGVLHSSCALPGASVPLTKIGGTKGAVWLEGDKVWVDCGGGPERVPDPEDLPRLPPDPPADEFLPAYARGTGWHTSGAEMAPFARLYQQLRAGIEGTPMSKDPPAATFADGAICQAVQDAVRFSARNGGRWVDVEDV